MSPSQCRITWLAAPGGSGRRRRRDSRRPSAPRGPGRGWPSGWRARPRPRPPRAAPRRRGARRRACARAGASWSVPTPQARSAPGMVRASAQRAADQLARVRPVEAHAALRGVHGLGDLEAEPPEMAAEGQRRVPVDGRPLPGSRIGQRIGHDMRGGVGDPREGAAWRVGGRERRGRRRRGRSLDATRSAVGEADGRP